MATPYSEIIDTFIGKVTDYDLPKFTDVEKDEIVFGFMKSACTRFAKVCKVDLYDRDEDLKQFNQDLNDEIVEVLSEIMLVEWLKPKVLSSENLKNCLRTKDYSMFSPHDMLKQLKETLELLQKESKRLINNYSFTHADLTKLGG